MLQECLPAPATTSFMIWHSATQPSIRGKGPMTPGHYHQSAQEEPRGSRVTLTVQPWGTLMPPHGTTQQPKRPQNRPGWEMVNSYHLLTYPDGSRVGRSHAALQAALHK